MSRYQYITYSTADSLVAITINRPPHNVLDIATMEELNAALDIAAADPAARALLLTGSGEKAFSAGVEIADHAPDRVERMLAAFSGIFHRLERIPVPTFAALNGVALGGGCELAIACDIVVAASHAKIGQPEIKLGVFPPVAAALLPMLIAPGKAYEMILGGEALTADEAAQSGLVTKVFPREDYAAGVHEYLGRYLRLSRSALVLAKKAIRSASPRPFLDGLTRADAIYAKELMATEDAREGLAAFTEKRAPQWKNK